MSEMARPGQNVREVFTASKHNRWQRAADVTSNGMVNQTSTIGEAKKLPTTVRNTTGSSLSRFAVLALGAAIITAAENLEQFQSVARFDGTVPTTGDEGNFGVILTDAPDGAIIDCVVAGEVQCMVNVTDTSHGYADITVDDATKLTSAFSGSAKILTPITETGDQWAIVRIGNTADDYSYYTSTIGTIETCSGPVPSSMLVSWSDGGDNVGAAVVEYASTVSNTYAFESDFLDSGYGSHLQGTGDMVQTPYTVQTVKQVSLDYNCLSQQWSVQLYKSTILSGTTWSVVGPSSDTDSPPVTIELTSGTVSAPGSSSYGGTLPSVTYTITEIPEIAGGRVLLNTATGWATENRVLLDNDIGIETDTGKYKIGIDSTAWNDLDYANPADVAAADITDATAAGQAILTAADNAAIRTLLNVEDGADVTDATNVTAAGALMDSEVTNLPDVKAFDPADYATAAQGTLADSAIQSGDLATVATTGDYDDLSNKPTLGTASAEDTSAFATAAQGTLADSATQPGDLGTAAAEDVGYFATAAQGSTADSTATGLSNHIGDSSDAHDASAISVADSGALLTATDVEGALAEIAGEVDTNTTGLSDHLGDTTDAHDASAISIADSGGIYTATDVEAALAEVKALADTASLTYTAVKTANYTATAGDYVLCNVETTGSFIVTLPSSPSAGDTVGVVLDTKTTAGRYVDINPGTETIHGSTTDIRMPIRYWSMVLKYDGSEWKIFYDGRFELIATSTITSSTASMAFADDWSVFKSLRLELANYLPVTDNADLQMRVSTNLGSSYDSTSGNYSWQSQFGVTSSTGGFGTVSATSMRVVSNSQNSTAFGSAIIRIIDHNDTAPMGIISDNVPIDSSGNLADHRCSGYYVPASAVNGFQLFPSSGNISRLKARLYGIR